VRQVGYLEGPYQNAWSKKLKILLFTTSSQIRPDIFLSILLVNTLSLCSSF